MEKDLKERIDIIKASKMPGKEKKRLIALIRKETSEERKFNRLPKEGRLRMLCSEYIGLAVDFAKSLGSAIEDGRVKDTREAYTKDLKRELRFELTMALKKANVLPLGR